MRVEVAAESRDIPTKSVMGTESIRRTELAVMVPPPLPGEGPVKFSLQQVQELLLQQAKQNEALHAKDMEQLESRLTQKLAEVTAHRPRSVASSTSFVASSSLISGSPSSDARLLTPLAQLSPSAASSSSAASSQGTLWLKQLGVR